LEGSSNEELLASLAGRPAAARLMGKFGGLSSLAQASFADLQQVPGVGPSKAAAIRSAFLLAQRLVRETYPDAPVVDSPERVAGLLREEKILTRKRLVLSPQAGNQIKTEQHQCQNPRLVLAHGRSQCRPSNLPATDTSALPGHRSPPVLPRFHRRPAQPRNKSAVVTHTCSTRILA